MDAAVARWLVSDAARPALAAAAAEPDPSSLAAATRLRALVGPAQAAAVLTQASLRRRAAGKFGADAAWLFFTPDGLEQATRAPVAARRAARLASVADRVVDLGCGIGADALAFAAAGLTVTAVERDEATAVLASANLGREVLVGQAEAAWPGLAGEGVAVFCDPARRTASGRSWRVEDLSPPWAFVSGLLDAARPACVKLGPGVPHKLLPQQAEAEWVSDAGTVVECALWSGGDAVPGRRRAVVDGQELVADGMAGPGSGESASVGVAAVGEWVYEPDGAVVRAGLVDALAGLLGAERLHPGVAYLAASELRQTPFATAFRVLEVLTYDEKVLRAWVRDRGIGTLEIKKRGVEVDPAELRRRLRPHGAASATLILTPTQQRAVVLVVVRA